MASRLIERLPSYERTAIVLSCSFGGLFGIVALAGSFTENNCSSTIQQNVTDPTCTERTTTPDGVRVYLQVFGISFLVFAVLPFISLPILRKLQEKLGNDGLIQETSRLYYVLFVINVLAAFFVGNDFASWITLCGIPYFCGGEGTSLFSISQAFTYAQLAILIPLVVAAFLLMLKAAKDFCAGGDDDDDVEVVAVRKSQKDIPRT